MTTISAKIVADSYSEHGHRLTTLLLRYPRWIHADGRTHRLLRIGEEEVWVEVRTPSVMEDPNLSRNASSSRAIPVERLIEDVMRDPAVPMYWGANQRGMQAGEECSEPVMIGLVNYEREAAWLRARNNAIETARAFAEAGYHKQIVNRLLEPFSHINVVVTATEWTNFFALRDHKDAEPHIRHLAIEMKKEMAASEPQIMVPGDWHLPFVLREERSLLTIEEQIGISVARCARTSYRTHDGRHPDLTEDLRLARFLLAATPLHASPAEHQATPDEPLIGDDEGVLAWKQASKHGNLKGWVQYRKTLIGECQ